MKLFYQKALMLLVFIAAVTSTGNAQFSNIPFELGLNFSALNPSTEFNESRDLKVSFYTRGFLRLGLADRLEGEIGGGYMKISGLNHFHYYYSTHMYPLDLRLVYTPAEFATWKPYVSAGFGLAYWTFKYHARERSPMRTDYDGFTRIIPLTAGAEFTITPQLSFDLNFGYTHSFTSALNAYKTENSFLKNDGVFNLGAGLTFAFNPPVKNNDFDGISESDVETVRTCPEKTIEACTQPKAGEEAASCQANTIKKDNECAGNGTCTEEKTVNMPAKDNPGDKAAVCQSASEPSKDEVFNLEDIRFAINSSAITSRSESILSKNLDYLLKHPEIKIQVNGHTDNTGQLSYNMKLSEKRAAAVKSWLVRKGIQAERISIRYFGPKEPLAPNNVADGRHKNRRAEFKVKDF
ncbi:MAG: OmpA family protein [Bacillota bacterium]